MRRARAVLVAFALWASIVPAVGSPAAAGIPCPAGAVSENVECVATISDSLMNGVISLNFIGDTMFVSTTTGLFSYDVSNPAAPVKLGHLPMYLWQNEDMDVDPVRERVFLSRDPRGFTSPATSGATFPYGAVHIIDVSDPALMLQVGFFLLPAGHTSTCINDCDFLWTGGPYKNPQTQPDEWVGRPIFGTDVRDPANPVSCPEPIDMGRDDGVTNYAHDVQVDPDGIAWVSGDGGVRGYWTQGQHLNPLTGKVETATACEPIPYGGGGTPYAAENPEGPRPYSKFMHNSWRNPLANIPDEWDPEEEEEDPTIGHVLWATEENLSSNCNQSGRFATYDLRGSYEGEGWKSTPSEKFRMRVLGTWWPQGAPGGTGSGCASAHYFDDLGDGVIAHAFYAQGTRFLDVTDPKQIRQIGYYRPNGSNVWAPYEHKGYIYIADNPRGVDIIRFHGESGDAPLPEPAPAPASTLVELPMDETFAYLCALEPAGFTVA